MSFKNKPIKMIIYVMLISGLYMFGLQSPVNATLSIDDSDLVRLDEKVCVAEKLLINAENCIKKWEEIFSLAHHIMCDYESMPYIECSASTAFSKAIVAYADTVLSPSPTKWEGTARLFGAEAKAHENTKIRKRDAIAIEKANLARARAFNARANAAYIKAKLEWTQKNWEEAERLFNLTANAYSNIGDLENSKYKQFEEYISYARRRANSARENSAKDKINAALFAERANSAVAVAKSNPTLENWEEAVQLFDKEVEVREIVGETCEAIVAKINSAKAKVSVVRLKAKAAECLAISQPTWENWVKAKKLFDEEVKLRDFVTCQFHNLALTYISMGKTDEAAIAQANENKYIHAEYFAEAKAAQAEAKAAECLAISQSTWENWAEVDARFDQFIDCYDVISNVQKEGEPLGEYYDEEYSFNEDDHFYAILSCHKASSNNRNISALEAKLEAISYPTLENWIKVARLFEKAAESFEGVVQRFYEFDMEIDLNEVDRATEQAYIARENARHARTIVAYMRQNNFTTVDVATIDRLREATNVASSNANSHLITVNNLETEQTCPICQENIPAESEAVKIGLPCKCISYYHKECIENWLKRKQSCPTCRVNLNTPNVTQDQ